MRRKTLLNPLAALVLIAGCTGEPLAPPETQPVADVIGAAPSSCPLATLPPGAQVVACYNTTLQPGVWHGFFLEQSVAQPTGYPDGAYDRTRLNHTYVLASPQGYTQWGASDPVAPGPVSENLYAFQAEYDGVAWADVLRLFAAADGAPQDVSVVVYWADATTVAADLGAVIDGLLAVGVVNGGQANALTKKIDHALQLLAKGKTNEAVAVLEDFIQQVQDLTGPVLSPDQAAELIGAAQYMIQLI